MISIVDYGMGNLGSIQNMLTRVGARSQIVSDVETIERAEKIILPGVGAFDAAIERLNESGLREVLDRKALADKVPVLGICLGMQLLARASEEGKLPGLGWIAAAACRFPPQTGLKIPHMGWNVARPTVANPLTKGLDADSRFYFVHSYFVKTDDRQVAILSTTHGVEFDSGLNCGNIYGTQFHPEKSHRFGMQLLRNFVEL